MTAEPLQEDFTDAHLTVSEPMDVAVGIEAVEKAMVPALAHLGPVRAGKVSLTINQKKGFDCPSCAWANPDHSKMLEFCENGIKAIVWDATPTVIEDSFWAEHSLSELAQRSGYWLGLQGRLARPVYKAADSDHYVPISWDDALNRIGDKLTSLSSPDEAVFYTSGKIMNEPAYLIQLLARAFGTNNLPDCSNMCHEATGTALTPMIGIGKSTVQYDDFGKAELIIAMGHNPGTNHPRMLTAFEECKLNGGEIVAVNPLPESSLQRYKNPQTIRGELGHGTEIADQFLKIRLGGDQHLLQAIAKRVFQAEERAPGTVLDHDFINSSTEGFEAYREQVMRLDDDEVLAATGLSSAEIDEVAERYLRSNATIITWALGITQQRQGVNVITDMVNLLMLRGNIGKPGAGPSPIRGHSNVQGDRTMGVWDKLTPVMKDALQAEYGFVVTAPDGYNSVAAMNAVDDDRVRVLISFAGNLIEAMSDSNQAEAGIKNVDLTVQVATKLNRSHIMTGKESILLPVLVRAERDIQLTGLQFVTSEDTVGRISMSRGELDPVSEDLRSDVWVISELGKRIAADKKVPWQTYQDDYNAVRDAISRVIPGFDNFNERITSELSFLLPDPPRDNRTFHTASGKAQFTAKDVDHIQVPSGRLLLQTMRAHDQFNTIIYGLDDRYRGIHKGRFVIFMHPDDIAELGLIDSQTVDVFSEWPGEADRVLRGYRVVSYPTARGCAAMYFPEANVLVPRASVDPACNTPTSKQVIIRVEPGTTPVQGSRPVAH